MKRDANVNRDTTLEQYFPIVRDREGELCCQFYNISHESALSLLKWISLLCSNTLFVLCKRSSSFFLYGVIRMQFPVWFAISPYYHWVVIYNRVEHTGYFPLPYRHHPPLTLLANIIKWEALFLEQFSSVRKPAKRLPVCLTAQNMIRRQIFFSFFWRASWAKHGHFSTPLIYTPSHTWLWNNNSICIQFIYAFRHVYSNF